MYIALAPSPARKENPNPKKKTPGLIIYYQEELKMTWNYHTLAVVDVYNIDHWISPKSGSEQIKTNPYETWIILFEILSLVHAYETIP